MKCPPRSNQGRLTALLVISDLEFGGAQRQVVELVNGVDPDVCAMHVCSLSTFTPLAQSFRPGLPAVNYVLRRFRLDFTVVPRLASLIRRVNADVVHSFLFDATIASRLAGRFFRRIAVIGSERNADYQLKRTDYLALRATRSLGDLVIANSNAGARFNSRLFGRPMDHYRVVHNGVDVDRFRPRDTAERRRTLELAEDQPVVGMFASFKPQKNHLLWIRAAREIRKRIPGVKFLFVGDELHKGMSDSTAHKQAINRAIDEFGLREHCLFLGNKSDVENYYPLCTLTVLPSLFEGTPNVLLESMACGTPVVASNVSDNAYLVRDGETGYIVPVNDGAALVDRVHALLSDDRLRARMSSAGRDWMVREFSCRRLAEKTVAAYRDALAVRRGNPGPQPVDSSAAREFAPAHRESTFSK